MCKIPRAFVRFLGYYNLTMRSFKIDVYKEHIRQLWLLSLPIIIGNLGHVFISFGDVLIASKHGTETIAAISIGSSVVMTIFIFGLGLLLSISPVLANMRGRRQGTKKFLMVSINYSLILGAIFCGLSLLSVPLMDRLGFEPHLLPQIKDYIFICSFSMFGAYLYQALKEFLQSYEIVMLPNMISIAAIFVNILLNIVLVFGLFGVPELGPKGLAFASLFVRSFMGLVLLFYCFGFIKGGYVKHSSYVKELLKIGYPISIALLLEFLGFNIVSIIVGRISGLLAGAHNIVLTLASSTFMVPLAISNAVAVKVAYANGLKDYKQVKRFALSGVFLSTAFMIFMAVLFFTVPEFFIRIFTDDKTLLDICVPILWIVALFQVFDGLQIALGGVLKGLKETKPIMLAIVFGYWVVGIPLGYYLAFQRGMELKGFWVGLASALFLVSLILGVILLNKMKQLKQEFSQK